MNQCERIIELLKGGEWVSNITIHETTGIYRYPSRIHDINMNQDKYGCRIETKRGNPPFYYYRLVKLSPSVNEYKADDKGQGLLFKEG